MLISKKKKMDVEHYETERKGKDICGLKKTPNNHKTKKTCLFSMEE